MCLQCSYNKNRFSVLVWTGVKTTPDFPQVYNRWHCNRSDSINSVVFVCFSAWAQAVAALMIIGLIILIIAFIISVVALCCSLNIPLLPLIGGLLILAGKSFSFVMSCILRWKNKIVTIGVQLCHQYVARFFSLRKHLTFYGISLAELYSVGFEPVPF